MVLARCLRDADAPPTAFRAFVRARRERVERIVKYAERINNNKAPRGVMRAFRDWILPSILRITADNKALRSAFDYRIDWGNRSAAASGVES